MTNETTNDRPARLRTCLPHTIERESDAVNGIKIILCAINTGSSNYVTWKIRANERAPYNGNYHAIEQAASDDYEKRVASLRESGY